MNEALHRLPLLCRVVEDEYGSCEFSRLRGAIVSKLELEPLMSESSPRKVGCDALHEPSIL
jgi:hypothetical protein